MTTKPSTAPEIPKNAPHYIGSSLPHKLSKDGRFVIYKYESSVRGSSAVKDLTPYTVFDSDTNKLYKAENLAYANSFIHLQRTGVPTLPWFGGATVKAPNEPLVKCPQNV